MLMVKTTVGQSKIDGIGLFADQFIPRGTLIWKFQPQFDLEINTKELARLSLPAREQFLKYAYREFGRKSYILCFDDARFFNHSDDPNVVDAEYPGEKDEVNVAARDIQKGEELTCDYGTFDADFKKKMPSR